MRSLGLLLLSGLMGLPASGRADELRLEVSFQEPLVRSTPLGDRIQVEGAQLMGRPGQPLLPQRTVYFVLPPGHEAESLRIEALVTEALPGAFDLAPAQLPTPLSRPASRLPTPRDPDSYMADAPFPGHWARLGEPQRKHGIALASVTLWPLSYRPASGRLTRLVEARLVLVTRTGGPVALAPRALPADLVEVARRAASSEALSSYPQRAPRGPVRLDPGTYEYLILAPAVFADLGGDDSLEALRDFRQSLGLSANLVTLEWVLANYPGTRPDGGQDDPTRIREFLTDAWTEWNTRYVLLVGDADAGDVGGESGHDLLPVRKLYVDTGHPDAAPDSLPADLYYSCLDGSFDFDADGRYGEPGDGPGGGEVDLLAELYVGRAPVDSADELRAFVSKTLAYEAGAGAWLKQVWMVGELLWEDPAPVWGGDALDELITGTDVGGFSTLGFASFPFFEPATLYDRDLPAGESWGAADLVPILDTGPHIVNHLGHSNVTYNMRLMNHNVDALINPHPFLHYSQGCYNGSFDNRAAPEEGGFVYSQDCIAEHLVAGPHGAFASVSNSRYGWGSSMTDGPSQRFHRQFWDAFFAEGAASLGQALADSKEDNAGSFVDPFIRWVGYENNLLGDPAVILKKSLNTTDPLLGLYPPRLSFVSRTGAAAPAPQLLRVRNDGLDTLSFSGQADQPWATLNPAAGDAPADVEVSVDPAGLAPGLHQAVLRFESPEAANSPLDARVEFLLVEVPALRVPHLTQLPQIDGSLDPGEYAGALALPIDPAGLGQVSLQLAVVGSRLFVAIEDRLDPSASEYDRLTLWFDRDLDGQWPAAPAEEGYYSLQARDGGRLSFIPAFNPGDGYQTDRRNRERDPPGFAGAIGTSDGHRFYELALDLDLSHVDVGPAGSFGMLIEVQNAEQWGVGTTTGQWPPVVPEIDDQLYFGQLDMLPDQAWLATLPGSLRFEAVRNGPSPQPADLSVVELLGGNFAFAVSSPDAWLEVSPAAGTTPGEVLVAADTSMLTTGSHQASLIITAAGLGNNPLVVPVDVQILPEPARIELDPIGFDLDLVEGDPPMVLSLSVFNRGELACDVMLSNNATWLDLNPVLFSLPALSEQVIELRIDASGLSVDEYDDLIEVSASGVVGGPFGVEVRLEVLRFNSAPPIPTLLSPGDGAEIEGPIELTAAPVIDPQGDPVSYTFELLGVSDEPIETGAGQAGGAFVTWQPANALTPGDYRWRVEASDDRGASSGFSQAWALTVLPEPEPGCGCAQAGPARPIGLLLMGLGLIAGLRRRRR